MNLLETPVKCLVFCCFLSLSLGGCSLLSSAPAGRNEYAHATKTTETALDKASAAHLLLLDCADTYAATHRDSGALVTEIANGAMHACRDDAETFRIATRAYFYAAAYEMALVRDVPIERAKLIEARVEKHFNEQIEHTHVHVIDALVRLRTPAQ